MLNLQKKNKDHLDNQRLAFGHASSKNTTGTVGPSLDMTPGRDQRTKQTRAVQDHHPTFNFLLYIYIYIFIRFISISSIQIILPELQSTGDRRSTPRPMISDGVYPIFTISLEGVTP